MFQLHGFCSDEQNNFCTRTTVKDLGRKRTVPYFKLTHRNCGKSIANDVAVTVASLYTPEYTRTNLSTYASWCFEIWREGHYINKYGSCQSAALRLKSRVGLRNLPDTCNSNACYILQATFNISAVFQS